MRRVKSTSVGIWIRESVRRKMLRGAKRGRLARKKRREERKRMLRARAERLGRGRTAGLVRAETTGEAGGARAERIQVNNFGPSHGPTKRRMDHMLLRVVS